MVISCHKKSVPIEVLELIFSDVPQASLPSLLLANSLFYAIAVRVLYRCLPEIPPTRTINMLKALVNNPPRFNTKKPSTYVRLLHLDFSAHRITGNFLRLLRKAFSLTPNLRDLSLEFSLHDNHFSLAWCLEDCPFQLRVFTASLRCDAQLAKFLECQSGLQELCLRGFQTTSPFILSPGSLPNLAAFRAVHAGAPVLETVIRGRPVEGVSLSLFSEDGFAPLDTLCLSQKQIKRLTIMSLDNTPPEVLLPEVAARLPKLEALHIVVLLAQSTHVSHVMSDNLLLFVIGIVILIIVSSFFRDYRRLCWRLHLSSRHFLASGISHS